MSNTQTKVSNHGRSRLAGVISGLILATLVLVGNFGGFQTARAVVGEGSATINGSTNHTVAISNSELYTVILTVGASGIAIDAASPTFTIPAGFTAPTVEEASAVAVNADGEWFVENTGPEACAVDMGPSAAAGQVITADVSVACLPGDTITLTYMGSSPATAMAPTNFDIKTADTLANGAAISIGTSPAHTVTVKGTAVVANHLTGAAVGNSLTGLAKIGGTDLVLGGFSIEATGEDVAVTTIRTTVTLGTMVIGELTNLRIVEDDGTGGGVANNGTMEAGELAAPLATIASPASGNNDFTVVDTISGGMLDNYFIVGTIASTVSDGDTIDVEATGAGSVSSGATSLASITLTGTSTNNTRTLTDTTAPTLVSAKFTAVNQLTLVFSELVDAVGGDFTNLETVGGGGVNLTVASISGSGTTTIVITTNESIITGAMNAGQVDIGAGVNDVSVANNAFVAVPNQAVTDGIVPTITSITSTTLNGSYNAPDAINVTVTFSEAVTLAGGTLDVTLDTGDVIAIIAFGPAATATGTYTVGAPDTSADLDSTAIVLNGGTLQDVGGNNVTVALPATTIADGSAIIIDTTAPTFSTAYVWDDELNGIIDRVYLTYSETMANTAAGANGFDVTGSNHGTCTGESIDPTATTSGELTFTCTSAYTAVGNMSIAFTSNSGLTDTAGNPVANFTLSSASSPAITDNADPVLMTTSPASAATSVDRQSDIVLTFSEPMAIDDFTEGAEFDVANFSGTFEDTWSVDNTVMTLGASTSFGCSDVIDVTLTAAAINATLGEALNTDGPQDGEWSFTTSSCSSGGGSSGSSAASTYSISVDEPVGGEALDAGDELSIQWTTGGTGSISYVDVSYSTNGSTYTTIADNTSNDGVYLWTIPTGINSDSVSIKVVATDLSESLDSDTSPEFTIGTPSTTTTDSSDDESVAPEAEGSGDFGYSPVTGELEEIDTIVPGDYFRGESYDTVYFLDNDETRRPFMDSQTYFTWHSTFNPVITVTDATLAAYPLGAPMLPQPGVVLIKIVSDADVFALEADPDDSNKVLKRLIPDEATAVAVYGSDWADYVIDIDVTLFSRFTEGSAIDDGYDPDLSIMIKRVDLN